MRTKTLWAGMLCFCMVCLFTAPLGFAQEQKELTLKFSFPGPAKGVHAEHEKWMGDEITKRTGGKVKFNYFWSGSLVAFNDSMAACGKGVVDFATVSGTATLSQNPHWSTLALPASGKDFWALCRASYDILTDHPLVKAEFEKLNVVPTHGYAPGAIIFLFKKPVTKLEDYKGLRIRSYGNTWARIFKKLGMVPVQLTTFDVYENMSKGVIDAGFSTLDMGNKLKWNELGKHAVVPSDFESSADIGLVVNKNLWNSFSPDTRDIINKVSSEWNERYIKTLIDENILARSEMEKKGVQFLRPSKEVDDTWQEAARIAREDWFQEWDAKGNKTKAVYEEFTKLVVKYEKEVAEKGYPWKR
jgi:TRAP-type C4-dicarboxylate transport system substrate-binding protein